MFFYFLCCVLIIQLTLTLCFILKMNNILLMNMFLVFLIIYSLYLIFSNYNKIIFYFVLLSLLYFIITFVKNINFFDINLFIISSLFCGIVNMLLILKLSDDIRMLYQPQFYISAGLLIYVFSISGVMLLFNYVVNPNNRVLINFYTIFSSVMTVIANLFYIKAFICTKKMIS